MARLILNADPLSPSKEMFKKLNWPALKELVKYKQAYKVKQTKATTYIQDLFTNVTDCVSYSLRSSAQNKFTFQEHILNPCHTYKC